MFMVTELLIYNVIVFAIVLCVYIKNKTKKEKIQDELNKTREKLSDYQITLGDMKATYYLYYSNIKSVFNELKNDNK